MQINSGHRRTYGGKLVELQVKKTLLEYQLVHSETSG